MFRKPFKVKNQTVIKGSDRKKLRADVGRLFPNLSPEELSEIIPNKEEITTAKICTHSGENGLIYCRSKNPIFFEVNKRLLPTVYFLWQFPELLPAFITWPPVFTKLQEGADLMLPGVVVHGELSASTFGDLNKGDNCTICLYGNRAPIAVGTALMSGEDMYQAGMRGKGVHPIHILGDELWSFGDKSQPPHLADAAGDAVTCKMNDIEAVQTAEGRNSSEEKTDPGKWCEGKTNGGGSCDGGMEGEEPCENNTRVVNCDTNEIPDMDRLKMEENPSSIAHSGASRSSTPVSSSGSVGEAGEPEDTRSPVEQMDELLIHCFKCAAKSSVKKSDLPLLTSNFYKNHMIPFCHSGQTLDIKKSSYKKLSKFLQAMQKEGYIKVAELNRGVDSITTIDKSHTDLRQFSVPDLQDEKEEEGAAQSFCGSGSVDDYKAPEIVDKFSVNAAVQPILSSSGYRKGSALTAVEVRNVLKEYVKNNQLQSEDRKDQVTLDPVLAHMLVNRAEGNVSTLRWEDFFSRFLGRMQPVHQMTFPGHQPIIRKGKVEPIFIDVVRRSGNKKVTLIDNLELFGIDVESFAHTIQIGVACSASVSPSPQKNRGLQVMVQGNQLSFAANLLTEKYKINKKYIQVLEKVPKTGKR